MSCVGELLIGASRSIGRTEARILLAHLLGKSKEFLIMHPEFLVEESAERLFTQWVTKRLQGVPIPYITGVQEFWGREFLVNSSTLIPRPDTELLIEKAIELAVGIEHPVILDLGTGSGCIAITLALEIPDSIVTAVDISSSALEIAQRNAQKLGATNVRFQLGNWFDPLPTNSRFDLIVSNPPYIEPSDSHLEDLRYEPLCALVDIDNGLGAYKAIAKEAHKHLLPNGRILFEHGYNQRKSVQFILSQMGFSLIESFKDYAGNDRLTMAIGDQPSSCR